MLNTNGGRGDIVGMNLFVVSYTYQGFFNSITLKNLSVFPWSSLPAFKAYIELMDISD